MIKVDKKWDDVNCIVPFYMKSLESYAKCGKLSKLYALTLIIHGHIILMAL